MPMIFIFTEVWNDDEAEWSFAEFQLEEDGEGSLIQDTTQILPAGEDVPNDRNPWLMALLSDCEDVPADWKVDPERYGGVIEHEEEIPADLSSILRGYVDELEEEGETPGSPAVVDLGEIEARDLRRFDEEFGEFFERLTSFLRDECGDGRVRLICWHQ